MDFQMSIIAGLTATKGIRSPERARSVHTLILAMTAHALKSDRERCVAAGIDNNLSEPVRNKRSRM